MRIAICYDWLDSFGGAERVVRVLLEIYPEAEVFSLVKSREVIWLEGKQVHVSWLNFGVLRRRIVLALLGWLGWLSFDFSQFDVVISVSSDQAKWIRHKRHVNVCLTPARHWWSFYQSMIYELRFKRGVRSVMRVGGTLFRMMDFYSVRKVEKIVAISEEVKLRVKRYYGKEVEVLYPPVEKIGYN